MFRNIPNNIKINMQNRSSNEKKIFGNCLYLIKVLRRSFTDLQLKRGLLEWGNDKEGANHNITFHTKRKYLDAFLNLRNRISPKRSVVGVISTSSATAFPLALFFSLRFFTGARISS